MGHILCEKHGGNGILICCNHLAEAINHTNKKHNISEIKVDILGDQSELFSHFLCENCMKEHKLDKNVILGEEDFGNSNILPADHPVCCKCFTEYSQLIKNA